MECRHLHCALHPFGVCPQQYASAKQNWGHLAEQELGEILHTKVTIGRVEVGLLNSISLHDVKLQDQEDKELLNSKLIIRKVANSFAIARKNLSTKHRLVGRGHPHLQIAPRRSHQLAVHDRRLQQ